MDQTAPDANSFASAVISGKLMGGQQPISGSTVNLYSVGTTGYGSAGTLLATTTTGIGGTFQFTQVTTQSGPTSPATATYGCPSSSTLLYLVATGGDPTNSGGASNAAIKMLDAIGTCGSVKTGLYNINEVSTVASLAALQQYINPINLTIGSPTTTATGTGKAAATTGILNAFNVVGQMMNFQAGQVNPTYVETGAGGSLTASPEVTKINTIADVMAACVNTASSSSGPCAALFSAATATPVALAATTNFATSYNPTPLATNTLQAALFMLQNPTDAGTQVTTCNGTAVTTNLACLYSLVGSTPPFTAVSTAPTDWTVGIQFGSSGMNSSSLYAVDGPAFFAEDAGGNLWIANYATGNSNLTELSPTGVPLVSTGGILALASPYSVIVDPSGNVWVANAGATAAPYTVTEYTSAGATNTVTVANVPYALSSDGKGNIFVLEGAAGELDEIKSGATTSTVIATGLTVSKYGTVGVDSNYNVWVTNGATGLLEFAYSTGSPTYPTTPATYAPSGVTSSEPMILDNSNNIWIANYSTTAPTASKIAASTPATGSTFPVTGATNGLEGLVVDGADNVWLSNYTTTTNGSYELSNAGVELSPTTGYAHSGYHSRNIAVDPSGNVWLGGTDNSTYATELQEILGAAVPVVTPIASGLPTTVGGTNLLGTTPQ